MTKEGIQYSICACGCRFTSAGERGRCGGEEGVPQGLEGIQYSICMCGCRFTSAGGWGGCNGEEGAPRWVERILHGGAETVSTAQNRNPRDAPRTPLQTNLRAHPDWSLARNRLAL